jgi:ribonucleoside-diphosphate reductase alpha chain
MVNQQMQVIKRNGEKEAVQLDKIAQRVQKLTFGLNEGFVDWYRVAKKVLDGLYDGVTSRELDTLAAETAASLTTHHPDYAILAGRLAVTAHYKETTPSFSETIKTIYEYKHPKTGVSAGFIADDVYEIVQANAEVLDAALDHSQDMNYEYFGFKTLMAAYLIKLDGKPVERIQHLLMRVSVGIWKDNIAEALATYDMLKERLFTHATPTLFNAGAKLNQLSSCFLLGMADSIQGMYKSMGDMAMISKLSGGIGLEVHSIRATGAYVRGTNGTSNGLIPLLKVVNETGRHVNQGGKRKGSIAVYLEPWHADVFEFLELRLNHGDESKRARDLFPALWIPDLFMERVMTNGDWSLMCPDECPGLSDVYDDQMSGAKAFTKLYTRYEAEGRARRTVKAVDLWNLMLKMAAETGTPYVLFKDAANTKSNQKNLGTIKSSNLCTEIIEYTAPDEIAVCNLISAALPRFVVQGGYVEYGTTPEGGRIPVGYTKTNHFDHKKLYDVIYQGTKNLNQVIDINYYPLPETRNSNLRHRPIGIGVQGMADTFCLLGLDYDSEAASQLNKEIFETISFAALTASNDLAQKNGPYSTFAGSPLSKGIFQHDMWKDNKVVVKAGKVQLAESNPVQLSGRWDWESLRASVIEHGVYNSLLLAPMPTASTAQILGNNESFEPYTSNLYVRRVISGEFMVANKHLVKDLVELGLWSEEIKVKIRDAKGSVQGINEIPEHLRNRYKTVWEIKQRTIIDQAADRGAFICQSQSLNLHIPNDSKFMTTLSTTWQYGFLKGLKTGSYYIRTKAALAANAALGGGGGSGLDMLAPAKPTFTEAEALQCSIDAMRDGGECVACGS